MKTRMMSMMLGLTLAAAVGCADKSATAPSTGEKAVSTAAEARATSAVTATAGKPTAPAAVEKPRIEIVFVMDTTGSMSGLIQAAKDKVWAIMNTVAAAKPTPDIKMGLVAYRDRGDTYVTKVVDLTADLDKMYSELMSFQANGGGDTPESVNQALNEAVTKMTWSADAKTYRVIFLVGDCPPHMNYQDDVKYPVTCEIAAKAGIIINAIQCGSDTSTPTFWGDIAKRSEGKYFRVEQSGSAIVASTPFDDELKTLGMEMDKTRIHYGNAKELAEQKGRADVSARLSAAAPAASLAQRAEFNASKAGAANFAGDKELVKDAADGKIKASALKDDELPADLKKLSPEERDKKVAEMQTKRQELQKKIGEVAAKRQAFIEAHVKQNADKGKSSLDQQLFDTMQTQAAAKNVELTGGPKY